ncbi:MAG: pantetheine-phosphate adenylyltransferase [Longicatena sp.]
MKKAIFPGSFDPITLGHVDIIERASKLFDEVVVVILENMNKNTIFTKEERLAFMYENLKHIKNVRIAYDHGLCVDFAKKEGACAIIRGVRSIKDYEYELDIAAINQHLNPEIETLCLFASPKYSYVSSSIIRELVMYHQDISDFVSDDVCKAFSTKTI